MTNMLALDHDLKPIAFAWPGGYPVYYIARDGWRDDETGELTFNAYDRTEFCICAKCAAQANKLDFILVENDVNYEDTSLYCEECNEAIESAYGDDEDADDDSTVSDEERSNGPKRR